MKMLQAGVVEPSSSPWSSPVCLVRKKCGGVRWCVDYRCLNDITVKDSFPLPKISECLYTLSGSIWFSSIDMASGYHQVSIHPDDRHFTSFNCRFGSYQYKRMPFGLCNSPATFSRVIQLVLSDLLWRKCLAYLDDVICLATSWESAIVNLRAVLRRFQQHNLKLKPSKCHLFQKELEFLGHLVSAEGVAVKPAHLKTMINWPLPTTKKGLESFLGFANYHRDHIPKFAEISDSLYKYAARHNGHIQLPPELVTVFEKLKQLLIDAPVLSYPDPNHPFILDMDASDFAIGGYLSQYIDGKEKVISYSSFTLTPAQRKYCTTRKELLGVVRFARQFTHYLLGKRFICCTDHNSLTWLLGFKNVEGQLARWLEELVLYDMVVIHRPGKEHVNADALSRIPDPLTYCDNYVADVTIEQLPCYPCAFCKRADTEWARFGSDIDYVRPLSVRQLTVAIDPPSSQCMSNWLPAYTSKEVRSKQSEDSDLNSVITWLESDTAPSDTDLALSGPAVKHYWLMKQQLVLNEGVLLYKWEDILEPRFLLVVPQSLRAEVLKHCHDSITAGHRGRDNTYYTCHDVLP